MLILRPTQTLAKKVKVRLKESLPLNENPFADWSARPFRAARVQYIILTNTASLYSVLMRGRGITTAAAFIARALEAIRNYMVADGCRSIFDGRIAPEAAEPVLAKALSRSVSGSMTDLVSMAGYDIEQGRSIINVSFRLNMTPMGMLEHRTSRAAFLDMRSGPVAIPAVDLTSVAAADSQPESASVAPPAYEVRAYGSEDPLPAQAEAMFARQLADSRKPLPVDRADRGLWRFALICAVTGGGEVLGGVHLDIGPINGAGPLGDHRLAYLERTLVRPEYRRRGIATALLTRAIEVAAGMGCEYIRCSNNWDNPAETALFRKCGFALVDLDGESDPQPCYLAVRPLRNLVGDEGRTEECRRQPGWQADT